MGMGILGIRKSFLLFLLSVLGGSAWLFMQNYKVKGLDKVEVEPRSPTEKGNGPLFPVATPANTSRDVIRIASFNIQVFGVAKLGNPAVMDVLTRVVQRFDVVAIQEIRARTDDVMPRFVELLNAGGRKYDFVIGRRLGRSNSKEQYAFVFDTETLEVDRNQIYTMNDPQDVLHREPLIGWFRARAVPPELAFTFSLVNIHTDPDEVAREISVLDDAFRVVSTDGRGEDDTILLGDLNTNEKKLGQLSQIPNFYAVIPAELKTNLAGTESYDNLIFDKAATTEFNGRFGVFDFVHEGFNLSKELAKEVSDHFPIWAEFSVYERGTDGRVAAVPGSTTTR